MKTLFMICAVLGGTIMLCQFLASLLGLGGDHGDGADADHGDAGGGMDHDAGHDVGHDAAHDAGLDHDAAWYFGMLSFRALSAALAFFGLAGLAALASRLDAGPSFLVALGSGAVALYLVGSVMRTLNKLRADGSVRIERAVGASGTVYLRVPGQKAGCGKVTLVLQNRTVEVEAVTTKDALPTGARVTVVAVLGPNTVEVELEPATTETPAHV